MASPWSGRREKDAFSSVFPQKNFTTPTPETTPNIGSISSPGRSFGGFHTSGGSVDESVKLNRAWSTATRHLTLGLGSQDKMAAPDSDTINAFAFVFDSLSKELAEWYEEQISSHFRKLVLPELQVWQQPFSSVESSAVLQTTLHILRQAQELYLGPLKHLFVVFAHSVQNDLVASLLKTVQTGLHSTILHSFERRRIETALADVIYEQLVLSLQHSSNPERCLKDGVCHCSISLDGAPSRELYDVGLGGSLALSAAAKALNKFLKGPAVERRCFEVDWSTQTTVMPKLRDWMQRKLIPALEKGLNAMEPGGSFNDNAREEVVGHAMNNLGTVRTRNVFDYVKAWPAGAGAIQDIREFVGLKSVHGANKALICGTFMEQVERRLLHAGASTAEILGIYVNVIHVFTALDSRGVLLANVSRPICKYLTGRDDTVSIIAASFLADVDQDGKVTAPDQDKICPDITLEVANTTLEDRHDKKTLDWEDMEWVPDPIDAGPDYKPSRSEDVVTRILELFEQDEFIKEVTTVLAQHLLNATDSDYVKEIRLLALFKSRLDASKLQAAEVMLGDMQHSVRLGKRINPFANYETTQGIPTPKEIQAAIPEEGITISELYSQFQSRMKQPQFIAAVKLVANKWNDLFFAKRTRIPADAKKKDAMNFKAQILSSFFWPQLRSEQYYMPSVLQTLNANFEDRFEKMGTQQKLQFRPALSKVSVNLELEDRTIEEHDIPGWRASVIDLFASSSGLKDNITSTTYDDSAGLTAEQIAEALSMDEDLVQDALSFWTSKHVLYLRPSGSYAVLERLDMEIETAQPEAAPEDLDDHISAVKLQDAMLRESAPMFSTFIANMLRNQGPKEVGGMMGITSLLKMVLPTFTYGEDEVRWLLGEMLSRGEVVREGEVWKVAT